MSRKVLFAVAAAVLLPAGAAVADDAKFVKLVHVQTGKVLGVENDSDDNEAAAVLADDKEGESRQWKLVNAAGYLKVVNRKSGKVLDVNNESTDEGGDVIQWEDKSEGTDNQRWQWAGTGAERRLKAKISGHVLDVGEGNKIVQKKESAAAKSQLWKVVEVAK